MITHLTIFNGARVARITCPVHGRCSHGVGAVGDPLLPFLGSRVHPSPCDGCSVELPGDALSVPVTFIDITQPAHASGRYPSRRVPWSALEAPDFDPFLAA